jgi:hypothetical protein
MIRVIWRNKLNLKADVMTYLGSSEYDHNSTRSAHNASRVHFDFDFKSRTVKLNHLKLGNANSSGSEFIK